MANLLLDAELLAGLVTWIGAFCALSMLLVVFLERCVVACNRIVRDRIERRYESVVKRAVEGDDAAVDELVNSPSRYRIVLAYLLILPLIHDRDRRRIARTRDIVRAMALIPLADRLLESYWWWRRALAVRALGLLQLRTHTGVIVAALDDPHAEVRAAALDAIADLRDPAALPALVVRLHDESLQQGRHAAAIAAFGSECEPFLLALAGIDPVNRLNYARALALCGTRQSRPLLCRWTQDARPEIRAAAFEALARTGLDDRAASLALRALESGDVKVRAMAAHALNGWSGGEEAVIRLTRHLDDSWPVAVKAAQSLRTMQDAGIVALQVSALRPDLAGRLAQQVLWEAAGQC